MPASVHLASLSILLCHMCFFLHGRNCVRHINDNIKRILVLESCQFEAAVKISLLRNYEFHLKASPAQLLTNCFPLLFIYGFGHSIFSLINVSGPIPMFSHKFSQNATIRPLISKKEVILQSRKQYLEFSLFKFSLYPFLYHLSLSQYLKSSFLSL